MELNDLTQNGQQSVYKKELYEHLNPFMESREYDIDKLRKQWKSICESWFSLNHTLPLKKSQLLIQGYTLLDMHPLFGEKLKKNKNTLDNIIRDGNHVYYASEADFFVSEDETTRKKTSFMYEAFDIRTKVVSEKEFQKELNDCHDRYSLAWSKEYREMEEEKLLTAVISYMKSWMMIDESDGEIVIYPAVGKMIGNYPAEFALKEKNR